MCGMRLLVLVELARLKSQYKSVRNREGHVDKAEFGHRGFLLYFTLSGRMTKKHVHLSVGLFSFVL